MVQGCTKYLRFIISIDRVQVDLEKVEVIHNWKQLTIVQGVQLFLGFCNFYQCFICNYKRIVAPLTQLTCKDYTFDFDHACIQAFEKLYTALNHAPLLAHFDIDQQCLIKIDASNIVIVAIFSQLGLDGKQHLVAYFSKSIALVEMNYPIYNKEILAIVQAFEHWHLELKGTDHLVEVLIDYKALEYFISTKSLFARQAHWAKILLQYNFKILYQLGKINKVDPLTQIDTNTNALNYTKESSQKQQLISIDYLDLQIVEELK